MDIVYGLSHWLYIDHPQFKWLMVVGALLISTFDIRFFWHLVTCLQL